MPKWCNRGVNSKTNPEKETNATKYFFIKTVTFEVAVFVFLIVVCNTNICFIT